MVTDMSESDWRNGGFTRRSPSDESLAWVAASIGRGGRVIGCRRMTGGVSSAVHRVSVERAGVRSVVVLRQYPSGVGLHKTVEQEVANLELVRDSGLPVPTVLAADALGTSTGGAPSLLMTRVPGEVDLTPADPRSWMTRIAELAASVHALDLPASTLDPWADSWISPRDRFRVPAGAVRPAVWQAAFRVMAEPAPRDTAVFLHGDLLPVNLLWSREEISGVVDWNGVHRGSRAVDVGHCRRYLACLFSAAAAEELRAHYTSVTGLPLDPWWDLYALLHYDGDQAEWIRRQVAGRRAVDVMGMTARVEAAVEAALDRLSR